MLTFDEELALYAELNNLLLDLKDGRAEVVEYGDPKIQPGSYFSAIRIRWMLTAGGKQFRICQLSGGMEGGGMYYYELQDASKAAMNLVRHYHRPTAMQTKLREKMRERHALPVELKWFAFKEGTQVLPAPRSTEADLQLMFPNAVTFNLGAEVGQHDKVDTRL